MTTAPPSPLVWPATDPPEAAAPHLAALARWVRELCLPELPPERAVLAEQPFGLRVELGRLGGPWARAFFSQHSALGLGTWLTWVDRDGRDGAAFVPPGVAWAIAPTLTGILRCLRGDEIELRYALAGELPVLPRGTWVHPDGWWDDWKARPVSAEPAAPTQGRVYEDWLYPRALTVLGAVEGPVRRVLDVCAGDGALSARVAAARPGVALTLLERNATACAAARARLGPGHEVRHGDVADPATWEGLAPVDVALLVGAVQVNVLRAADARAVMGRVRGALRPGGVAVVTGWSACLLDRPDLEACGFEVLNTAVPPGDDDPNPRQLAVLRRP